MNRKRREISTHKQCVLVVLDGIKASSADEETGLLPLHKAIRVVGPQDEILVLALLIYHHPPAAAESSCVGDHNNFNHYQRRSYVKFLHQEISLRKEAYRHILSPFYGRCKTNGVNFQVKVAAGFQPKDIIIEEANTAKATWIVMDSCFAKDLSFRLNGTNCNVSLVSDHDEEDMIYNSLLKNDGQEASILIEVQRSPKSPKLSDGELSADEQFHDCTLSFPVLESQSEPWSPTLPDESREARANITMSEPYEASEYPSRVEITTKGDSFGLELPLQLSWKVIMQITRGFESRICTSQDKKYSIYDGFLDDHDDRSLVLVKSFMEDSTDILEAEKKAALTMHHRNIMGLIGCHKNENATVLIFPSAERGSLATYLCGSKGKQVEWGFQDKMDIAIGVAQGLRYMHEECPGGPIAHGELLPCNIYIRHDFRPLISGFGKATRIHLEHAPENRFATNPSNEEAMAAIKSDILSFGVLLVRLFCRKCIPQDDKELIEWARPLLVQREFPELLDDDSDSDVHGIYRVMSAATQCTRARPDSRPCMSEVISILKGENFCAIQLSPYTVN